MLIIDNKELKVIKQEIWINNCTFNWVKGYEVFVQLEFVDNTETGYLNLSAGFEKSDNITEFLNREYKAIPYNGIDSEINMFEIYDTTKFLDTEIDSEIKLKLNNIIDNKVKAYIELNDELIKINFDGYLDKR